MKQLTTLATSLIVLSLLGYYSCADPENFVRGGPTLTGFFLFVFFLVHDGRDDPNTCTTKSGPSSAHQGNAIEMAFRWCVDDGPTLNYGSVAL